VVRVRIYVEGGGGKIAKRKCREGFTELFEKIVDPACAPLVIPCGPRGEACKNFCAALRDGTAATGVLLVDSEYAVAANDTAWRHLARHDKWKRPAAATGEQAHLMVQCMESWFLADQPALAEYYGQGFSGKALPQCGNVELIPKKDVLNKLTRATSKTQKGRYSKGAHSFEILARLNPALVEAASPFAKRLFDFLRKNAAHK